MVKLPSSLFKAEKWKAYKGEFPLGKGKDHRIIIIFKCSEYCHYFIVTSQIEKAKIRSRNDIGSLVELTPAEWSDLSKTSCIECGLKSMKNNIISEDYLRSLYEKDCLDVLGEVPEIVKEKIRNGIIASKTYTDKQKEIYTKP